MESALWPLQLQLDLNRWSLASLLNVWFKGQVIGKGIIWRGLLAKLLLSLPKVNFILTFIFLFYFFFPILCFFNALLGRLWLWWEHQPAMCAQEEIFHCYNLFGGCFGGGFFPAMLLACFVFSSLSSAASLKSLTGMLWICDISACGNNCSFLTFRWMSAWLFPWQNKSGGTAI